MKKLAIITTHPIQYQTPLFKSLQKKKSRHTYFLRQNMGSKKKNLDPEFLTKIKWDNSENLLEGYKSYFPKKQKYKIDDFRLSFSNIENIFKKKKFDAILVLGWHNLHYLRAILYALRNKKKLILRAENNLKQKNSLLTKIVKIILFRIFFKFFDYFLSIGKLNKEFYLSYGVKKYKIYNAPYFVDNDFFIIKINKKLIKKN